MKKIQKFKIYHNNSPSTVTGKAPSELIFAYKPKTLLDLVNNKNKESIDKNGKIGEISDANSFKLNSKYRVGQNAMYPSIENIMLRSSFVLTGFRQGKMILSDKDGDINSVSNWRPLTIYSVLRALDSRLRAQISINCKQRGFVTGIPGCER